MAAYGDDVTEVSLQNYVYLGKPCYGNRRVIVGISSFFLLFLFLFLLVFLKIFYLRTAQSAGIESLNEIYFVKIGVSFFEPWRVMHFYCGILFVELRGHCWVSTIFSSRILLHLFLVSYTFFYPTGGCALTFQPCPDVRNFRRNCISYARKERMTRRTAEPMNDLVKPIYRPYGIYAASLHKNILKCGRQVDAAPISLRFNHYWGLRLQNWGKGCNAGSTRKGKIEVSGGEQALPLPACLLDEQVLGITVEDHGAAYTAKRLDEMHPPA